MTDHPPLENVKGNLRRKLEFWKRIGTSKFILNVIERGYMLPFLSLPKPAVFRNNRSSLAHAKFVEDAIRELVESGRVIEVVVPPLVVNPLSVSVQATGKKRLILDLRYVNKCLRKMRVKYEDWKVALSYFITEAFMFSFDLKSDTTILKFLRVIKPTLVSLGDMASLISKSFTCLQFCLLVYRPHLTFSPKLLSLWKSIGDIKAYALLFFLTMAWP